ncbi:MAG: ADP-ribosylglycohydrolase family protein [Anaerolineae bacterium]|nr:ADP-ribosylglycohydrolase family protein [Anaerolineae bacterium]
MSEEQAQAMLFGLAVGDALGWPVEFMQLPAIREQYGPAGIQAPPHPALYTDDTQMTAALAEALIEVGNSDLDRLMQAVGGQFVTWLHSPENNRAPGNACMAGTRNFEAGASWREAGVEDSKGCGAAMRVAPIGYCYQHDETRLREVAHASSLITHRHPTASAAASAAAYLVKLALDGLAPDGYLARLFAFTAGLSDELDQALRRIGHVLGWGNEVAAMRHIGAGWIAEEAVALALYCVLRYPDDYVGAVRRAANSDGDSDSVACIAGGVLGARLGLDAIPADWRARCEHAAYLADLGTRLAVSRDAR